MAKIGDYELDVAIGEGATGTVWKAHRDGPVTQVVALKRLPAGEAGRGGLDLIRREAALLTELDHPHVVRLVEVLDDGDGGLAIAMQFASGGSFEALLAERGRLPAGELVAVVVPVAEALASAHRRGILHGDVKPANILLTFDGEPLLADFGVARALGSSGDGQVAGSAAYLAPESVEGAPPHPRADVYSLAVVCYEALAGKLPFEGADPQEVIRAAQAGQHEALTTVPGIPQALAEVVELGMARDPGRRFGSADDFAASLRSTVSQQDLRLPGALLAVSTQSGRRGAEATTTTDTYGPRPPQPTPTRPGVFTRLVSGGRRIFSRVLKPLAGHLIRPKSLAVGLGAVLLLVGAGLFLSDGASGPRCPETAAPDVGPEAQLLVGDVDGNGCQAFGVYELRDFPDGHQRMVATVTLEGSRRYVLLGEPGDQLFLGDWYCDGRATPALYRPAYGEVQYFDSWPEEGSDGHVPANSHEAPAHGSAALVDGGDHPEHDGCDRISVTVP